MVESQLINDYIYFKVLPRYVLALADKLKIYL